MNSAFDTVDLTFSESLDAASLTSGDILFSGPSGSISIAAPVVMEGNKVRVSFPAKSLREPIR